MRACIVACSFTAALIAGGMAGAAAAFGWTWLAAGFGSLAALWLAGAIVMEAWTRPRRPRLTRAEIRALDDRLSLKGLLDICPRREEGPAIEAIPPREEKR